MSLESECEHASCRSCCSIDGLPANTLDMELCAVECRFLSLSPAKTPNPTNANTAMPAPTPMPADVPVLSPDCPSRDDVIGVERPEIALAFVSSVSLATSVDEEPEEVKVVYKLDGVDGLEV